MTPRLFVQLGEDLENDGAKNQQHAANNGNHHGVERRRLEHGYGPLESNVPSLGRFTQMCGDVYQK